MKMNSIVFSEGPVEVYQNMQNNGFYWSYYTKDNYLLDQGPFETLYAALDAFRYYKCSYLTPMTNVVPISNTIVNNVIQVDFKTRKRVG